MKILIWSVAPWLGSAYAKQGCGIAKRLKAKGYDVVYLACYGVEGGPIDWPPLPGVPIYGTPFGSMGTEVIGDLIYALRIDHVIQHFDTWQLGDFLPTSGLGNMFTCYAPIEGDEITSATASASSDCFIASPSETGQKAWQKLGVPAVWLPHGIDTTIFHPLIVSQSEVRKEFSIPEDAFVFCIVAQNNWRKNLGMQVEAFAEVSKRHKNVYLILHTALQEDPLRPQGASDLQSHINKLGIRDKVRTPQQWSLAYYPDSEIAKVYQASDINLFATCAEGFGLPIIEAGACGVPSIVTDFSASPEIGGEGCIPIKPIVKVLRMSPGGQMAYPDFESLCFKMAQCITSTEILKEYGEAALANAQQYSWEKVINYWDFYLKGRPQVDIQPGKVSIGKKQTGY
jgi:glycosyltransferase involved in cell wall biosynthesis